MQGLQRENDSLDVIIEQIKKVLVERQQDVGPLLKWVQKEYSKYYEKMMFRVMLVRTILEHLSSTMASQTESTIVNLFRDIPKIHSWELKQIFTSFNLFCVALSEAGLFRDAPHAQRDMALDLLIERNYWNTHFDPLTKKQEEEEENPVIDATYLEELILILSQETSRHQKLRELIKWGETYGFTGVPEMMLEFNALLNFFLSDIVLSIDGIREKCPCCSEPYSEIISLFQHTPLTLSDENKDQLSNIQALAQLQRIDQNFFPYKLEEPVEEELSMDDNLGHFDDDDVIDAQTHDYDRTI